MQSDMNLSMSTLVAIIILCSSVLALSLAVVAYRRSNTLWIWAWALAAHTLAFIVIALRAQVGDTVTIVGGNVLLAATFSLFAAGLSDFQKRSPSDWMIWAPIPLVAIGSAYWLDNTTGRSIFCSTVFILQCLFILIALIRQHRRTAGRGQYLLMTGFVLLIAVVGYRILEVLAGRGVILSSMVTAPLQTATFLASIVTLMLLASGITLMIQERAEDELEAANLKLADLANTDGLTGLANRRRFDQAMAAESARAKRSGRPLAILMIDIDWFKKYNDQYGHQAGDDCLKRVAAVLQNSARRKGSDLAARYGGEEFTIISADTDADQAAMLANSICQAVAAMQIPHNESSYGKVTISIGFAAGTIDHASGAEALLKRADTALYEAKNSGRNRIAAG